MQRGPFAQTQSGGRFELVRGIPQTQSFVTGNAGHEYGGLAMVGFGQFFNRTVKTDSRQLVTKYFVSATEKFPAFGIRIREISAHSHCLGSLPRENDCLFSHVGFSLQLSFIL